jgi:uncharacterized membrane protein (UPF0127 family)
VTSPDKLWKEIVVAAVLIGVAAAGFMFMQSLPNPDKVGVVTDERVVNVSVEIAENETERRQGLMNRTALPIDQGMLFVFPEEDERSFWMKNTYIPLDIAFIDSRGEILNIEEAYPQPNTSDDKLRRYRSDGEAMYVLELNASFSERYSVDSDDRIKLFTAVK